MKFRLSQLRLHPIHWLIAAFIASTQRLEVPEKLALFALLFISLTLYGASKAWISGCRITAHFPSELGEFRPTLNRQRCWRRMACGLAGPLTSTALYLGFSVLAARVPGEWGGCLQLAALCNAYWALFQLLPISPFDGWFAFSGALEAVFGLRGFIASISFSAALGAALSIASASTPHSLDWFASLLMTVTFAQLSHTAHSHFKGLSDRTASDFDPDVQAALRRAQRAIVDHRCDEAIGSLNELQAALPPKSQSYRRIDTLRALALRAAGKMGEALSSLAAKRLDLSGEAQQLLHELAYKEGDYALVRELANGVYRTHQRPETAMINSLAFAHLGDRQMSMRWLHCAQRDGYDTSRILAEPIFKKWSPS